MSNLQGTQSIIEKLSERQSQIKDDKISKALELEIIYQQEREDIEKGKVAKRSRIYGTVSDVRSCGPMSNLDGEIELSSSSSDAPEVLHADEEDLN